MYNELMIILAIAIIIVVVAIKAIHFSLKILMVGVVVLLIMNYFGMVGYMNQPINILISGEPDKSCSYDNECVLKQTICNKCDCGDAVNRDWKRTCPLNTNDDEIVCENVCHTIEQYEIKCFKYKCTLFLTNPLIEPEISENN